MGEVSGEAIRELGKDRREKVGNHGVKADFIVIIVVVLLLLVRLRQPDHEPEIDAEERRQNDGIDQRDRVFPDDDEGI